MHRSDRALSRTPISITVTVLTVAVILLLLFRVDGAEASSIPTKCPSGATLSAKTGLKISALRGYDSLNNSGCIYKSGSTFLDITEIVGFAPGPSIFRTDLKLEAARAKTTVTFLPNLGSIAAEYSAKGRTVLQALIGRTVISFSGNFPAKAFPAIAKATL